MVLELGADTGVVNVELKPVPILNAGTDLVVEVVVLVMVEETWMADLQNAGSSRRC